MELALTRGGILGAKPGVDLFQHAQSPEAFQELLRRERVGRLG
jgi:hypothetical protein